MSQQKLVLIMLLLSFLIGTVISWMFLKPYFDWFFGLLLWVKG